MTYANGINSGNKDMDEHPKTKQKREEEKRAMYAIIDAVVSTELFVVVYSISIDCLSGMSTKQYFT